MIGHTGKRSRFRSIGKNEKSRTKSKTHQSPKPSVKGFNK